MSLYADEDVSSLSVLPTLPSSSTASSSTPSDPLQAFAAALSCPAESPAQAEAFYNAGRRFEEQTDKLPELVSKLLPMVVDSGESLLRSWTLEMIGLAVGRSGLKVDVKSQLAQTTLDALNRLLQSPHTPPPTLRILIPIFSTIHPILFRLLAINRPPQHIVDTFNAARTRIVALTLDPSAQPQNVGIKAAGWKFIQKVLIAGTRGGAADPRLQKQQVSSDPSISIITRDSPLDPLALEEEANLLRTQLVTQMYTSSDPGILQPIFQTLPQLCKSRPSLSALIVQSLTSWTPAALEGHRSAMQIRHVEKSLRSVMMHLVKHPPLSAFVVQLNDALLRQKQRMDVVWAAEKAYRKAGISGGTALGKHPLEAESSEAAAKRARLLDVQPARGHGRGETIDVSKFALEGVVEAVMEGLDVVSVELLQRAFESARRALQDGSPDAQPLLAATLGGGAGIKVEEDEEVINPLDMDLEDEDDLLLGDAEEDLDEEMADPSTFLPFILPPPAPLALSDRDPIIKDAFARIWESGAELAEQLPPAQVGDGVKSAVDGREVWMLLLARLGTRAREESVESQKGRKDLVDFVVADFAKRSKFASIWLNEEWYNSKLSPNPSASIYTSSLDSIVQSYLTTLDPKDKTLTTFLPLLPEIPGSLITQLAKLCRDSEKSIVGFLALRDLVESRPPVRSLALETLLELCTHEERKIRVMAISTVRRWVPDSVMSKRVVDYGLAVFQRLIAESESAAAKEEEKATEMEDGEAADEPLPTITSQYLPEPGTVTADNVQQHVELLFALSRRHQDPLLSHIFRLYPLLPDTLHEPVEALLAPLIQSLGASDKLLDVLRHYPEGSEKLALRVVGTLVAEGKGGALVPVVKGLMGERDVDIGFVVPIIGELDKDEIESQIPRIVSLLGSSPPSQDTRDLVRTAFASMLGKLTPADLMVALHTEEVGLKATIEAIGICFSLTTLFPSNTIATSLSRIADRPTPLPLVFLRTTIQAVTTYKSLIPFVANQILPKLAARKVWENPQLWDGFGRLAKMIAPQSYGAICQLPKEWVADLVKRQPGLREGLRGFLKGRGMGKGVEEILGEVPVTN